MITYLWNRWRATIIVALCSRLCCPAALANAASWAGLAGWQTRAPVIISRTVNQAMETRSEKWALSCKRRRRTRLLSLRLIVFLLAPLLLSFFFFGNLETTMYWYSLCWLKCITLCMYYVLNTTPFYGFIIAWFHGVGFCWKYSNRNTLFLKQHYSKSFVSQRHFTRLTKN